MTKPGPAEMPTHWASGQSAVLEHLAALDQEGHEEVIMVDSHRPGSDKVIVRARFVPTLPINIVTWSLLHQLGYDHVDCKPHPDADSPGRATRDNSFNSSGSVDLCFRLGQNDARTWRKTFRAVETSSHEIVLGQDCSDAVNTHAKLAIGPFFIKKSKGSHETWCLPDSMLTFPRRTSS